MLMDGSPYVMCIFWNPYIYIPIDVIHDPSTVSCYAGARPVRLVQNCPGALETRGFDPSQPAFQRHQDNCNEKHATWHVFVVPYPFSLTKMMQLGVITTCWMFHEIREVYWMLNVSNIDTKFCKSCILTIPLLINWDGSVDLLVHGSQAHSDMWRRGRPRRQLESSRKRDGDTGEATDRDSHGHQYEELDEGHLPGCCDVNLVVYGSFWCHFFVGLMIIMTVIHGYSSY